MSNFVDSITALCGKMDGFISSKTVVGEPVTVNDVVIVPLVDVSLGLGSGGANSKDEKKAGDYSGGGLGAKISPSAVIVIQNGTAQLINVKNQSSVNKLIDMVPGIVSKLEFSSKSKKNKNEEVTFEDERIVEE